MEKFRCAIYLAEDSNGESVDGPEWVRASDMAQNFKISTQKLVERCLSLYPDETMPVITEKSEREFLVDGEKKIYVYDDCDKKTYTGFHIGEQMVDGVILKYEEILIPAGCDDDLWANIDDGDENIGFGVWEGENGEIAIIPAHNGIIEWSARYLISNGIGDARSYKKRAEIWGRKNVEGLTAFLTMMGVKLEKTERKGSKKA